MSTYHSLINEGKERLYKAGQGEQAAQLFMVELCRQKDINLYISMDEEADEQIQTDYLEGIHLMENGELKIKDYENRQRYLRGNPRHHHP